jgi:arylamine N-acetyltransferase
MLLSRPEVDEFLRYLEVDRAEAPSVAALRRIQGAFLERVPYETVDIQIGRKTDIDPRTSVERILRRRRGGYCFQLNGALALLLRSLGYHVTLHRGGVHRLPKGRPTIDGSHLALTVAALPDAPRSVWLVDVGLGDGPFTPLPLRHGRFVEGGFSGHRYRFELSDSEVQPDAWQLRHLNGTFTGMDFAFAPATVDDFVQRHTYFSTSRNTHFYQLCTVMRRNANGTDILRALTLTRQSRMTTRHTLETRADWFTALDEVFRLPLDDLTTSERDRLWNRAVAQHEAFLERQSTQRSA